jgi:hypothetical protein
MRSTLHTVIIVSLLFAPIAARAQTTVDPSGHWEGAISAPFGEIQFQVDLARNSEGKLVATYSRPENHLNGFPLTNVALDGRSIRFELPLDGGTRFQGALLSDGKSISGEVSAAIGSAPFKMDRTGDAHIEEPPKNAAIDKQLEGAWSGALSIQGMNLRLALRMANQPDGTATATMVSLDQGGIEFPLGIKRTAATLTLSTPALGGDFYTGTLNAAGTELVGTFAEGPLSAALTFRRAASFEANK